MQLPIESWVFSSGVGGQNNEEVVVFVYNFKFIIFRHLADQQTEREAKRI